jgi:hypothetical protein
MGNRNPNSAAGDPDRAVALQRAAARGSRNRSGPARGRSQGNWHDVKTWYWLAFLREPQRVVSTGLAVMLGVTALILSDGFIDRCLHLFREDIIRCPLRAHSGAAGRPGRLGAAGARARKR